MAPERVVSRLQRPTVQVSRATDENKGKQNNRLISASDKRQQDGPSTGDQSARLRQTQQQPNSYCCCCCSCAGLSQTGSAAGNKRRQFEQNPAARRQPRAVATREAHRRAAVGPDDCAKCQLIVRWTSAQAKLVKAAAHKPEVAGEQHESQCPQYRSELNNPKGGRLRHRDDNNNDKECESPKRDHLSDRNELTGRSRQMTTTTTLHKEFSETGSDGFDEDEEAEISSLTESEGSDLTSASLKAEVADYSDRKLRSRRYEESEKWSISSRSLSPCCVVHEEQTRGLNQPTIEAPEEHNIAGGAQSEQALPKQRAPSLRRRKLASLMMTNAAPSPLPGATSRPLAPLGLRKRRPAPLPPVSGRPAGRSKGAGSSGSSSSGNSSRNSDQTTTTCDNINVPSSSASTTSSFSSSEPCDSGAGSESVATAARGSQEATDLVMGRLAGTERGEKPTITTATMTSTLPNLLTESEVYSIEHFLRSHKSSIYVCGCMANLYLTTTELVNNGRCSRPTGDGWRLSKTGVPVLTFDSGLTRNRNKRRLSVSLTERGSGFVLWSDTIDHLSNYRAFSSQVHGGSDSDQRPPKEAAVCETFHVMYLSSNHRIMVGLSFDEAKCAKLFLRQVELVTSDPANISLTGPKLGHRLVSVSGRLSKLLTPARSSQQPEVGGEEPNGRDKAAASACGRGSKISRLLAARGSRRRKSRLAAPTPSVILHPNQAEYSWSTLKRAIRFGQQARARKEAEQQRDAGRRAEDETAADGSPVSAALIPKPLAQLAMAGKHYRAGKRMPRKCDISAPCLFQHVTRVDLANLGGLYSRTLIAASAQDTPTDGQLPPPTDGARASAERQRQQQDARKRMISQTNEQTGSQMAKSISHKTTTISSSSCSSTSSCYSSGCPSESPANSEYSAAQFGQPQPEVRNSSSDKYGRRPNTANAAAHHHLSQLTRQQPRPLPPRVPRRTESISDDLSHASDAKGHKSQQTAAKAASGDKDLIVSAARSKIKRSSEESKKEHHSASGSGAQSSKIKALIRELQTQTSAELVEAKRKLMADIANQVMVRNSNNNQQQRRPDSPAASGSAVSHL